MKVYNEYEEEDLLREMQNIRQAIGIFMHTNKISLTKGLAVMLSLGLSGYMISLRNFYDNDDAKCRDKLKKMIEEMIDDIDEEEFNEEFERLLPKKE